MQENVLVRTRIPFIICILSNFLALLQRLFRKTEGLDPAKS